jgi:RNA polymerase sigma factor (sigma-70 family)
LHRNPSPQTHDDHEQNRIRVDRVLAGDHSAFSEIYAAYSPKVHGFIYKRVGALAEVDDLTQETFVQLFRSLASFEGRSSLLTWTFGIAQNVCSRHFRHCSRWMIGARDARVLTDRPVDAAIEQRIDASRALERCDRRLALARRPAHRKIFELRYGKSQSIQSIAENVGKSKDAVKISLRRSRGVLAEAVPDLKLILQDVHRTA